MHDHVLKLTPVPGQELAVGGQVGGEITLTGLSPETVQDWTSRPQATADLALPELAGTSTAPAA